MIARVSLLACRTVMVHVAVLVWLPKYRRAERQEFESSPLAASRAEWTHEDLAPLLAKVQKTHNQRGRARRRLLRSLKVAKAPQSGRHRRGAA